MKNRVLYIVCMAIFLWLTGCKSDRNDDLSPSLADIDWFKVEDGSDPVQHLRYQIYKEYGLPVFYTDTLGSVERGISRAGKPIVHYEVFDLYYWITDRTTSSRLFDISLNKPYLANGDMTEVTAGLEFMRDYVLPVLNPKRRPMSFLMVDEMYRYNSDKRGCHEHYSYYAMTTVVASRLGKIKTMTPAEKRYMAGYVIAAIYVNDISDNYMKMFEEFFDATPLQASGSSRYGARIGSVSNSATKLLPGFDWLTYGFLRYSPTGMVNIKGSDSDYSPTEEDMQTKLTGYFSCRQPEDIFEYIAAVLADDETAFKAKYASYPVILAKYDIMKRLLPQYITAIEQEDK